MSSEMMLVHRAGGGAVPAVPSRPCTCSFCGEPCFVSKRSPVPEKYVCVPCFPAVCEQLEATGRPVEMVVAPVTAKEVAEHFRGVRK